MKKITYKTYGRNHSTKLSDVENLRLCDSREIIIRVKASSLNPVDWKIRNGDMKMFTGSNFPRGMGSDFAGVIEEVASEKCGFSPGDRVFGFLPFKVAGAFSEQVIAEANLIGRIPAQLSFEEAACLPMAGSAALTALTRKTKIIAGDRVFIAGCVGGVGHIAVQVAKSLGAHVSGSCSTMDFDLARSLGVDEVYNYEDPSSAEITPCGIIFDTAGKMCNKEIKKILKKDTKSSEAKPAYINLNPTPSSLLFSIFSRTHKNVITTVNLELIRALESLAKQGRIRPHIGLSFPLENAVEIIEKVETGKLKVKGKIVFTS